MGVLGNAGEDCYEEYCHWCETDGIHNKPAAPLLSLLSFADSHGLIIRAGSIVALTSVESRMTLAKINV